MTHRERWLRTMHFQSIDHVPDEEFGYWSDTFDVWQPQGLPRWVDDNHWADAYFGFAPRKHVPINLGLLPPFDTEVLEEDERHKIVLDSTGATSLIHKDDTSSIPKYLKFPVENRTDWDAFKQRLDPDDPRRYPLNWNEMKEVWKNRDYPLGVNCGSLYGWVRNWMGFENAAMAVAAEPDLIEEMMEHITTFVLKVLDRAVRDVQLDFGAFWEDMCFRNGPMISPRMFKQLMVPRYQRITGFLKEHGVDVVYVDCDGDINQLVGLWIEGGVNCMFPLEIRGGSDPYPMRERYGRQVLLMGGVDKTKLIDGKAAIRQEVCRLEKLVAEGGFVPHVDHRCPPDVRYENYLYYLKTKREAFGIPEPPPFAERRAQGEVR
jgi:uroporphyrinogen-III decarboxylase